MTPADLLLYDLAAQIEDPLNLEHDLHLCEWFSDRADHLPALVREALDVHTLALQQAEATRLRLREATLASQLNTHSQ